MKGKAQIARRIQKTAAGVVATQSPHCLVLTNGGAFPNDDLHKNKGQARQ
jgi:hypothetical protein